MAEAHEAVAFSFTVGPEGKNRFDDLRICFSPVFIRIQCQRKL